MLRAALALVLLALAGCGNDELAAAPPQPGRLVVLEDRAAQPLYTEGSVGFLTIKPAGGGKALVDGRVDAAAPGTSAILFERRVAPGEYRVGRYERPCDGNCGYLDPPESRCSTSVTVKDGATTRIFLRVQPGVGCEIYD